MNFLKNVFGKKEDEQNVLSEEFLNVLIKGKLIQYLKNNTIKVVCQNSNVQFGAEKSAWKYYLVIQQQDLNIEQKDLKTYYFPINENLNLQCMSFKKGGQQITTIQFLIEETKMELEIDTTLEGDKVLAAAFQDSLTKLIYQNKYEQSYQEAQSPQDYNQFCKVIQQKQEVNMNSLISSNQLNNLPQNKQIEKNPLFDQTLEQLKKDSRNKISLAGTFYQKFGNNWSLKARHAAFVIFDDGNFNFKIKVIDQDNMVIHEQDYQKETQIQANVQENNIGWLYINQQGYMELLKVDFHEAQSLYQVQFVVYQCNLEMNTNKNFQETIEEEEVQYFEQAAEQPAYDQIIKDFKGLNLNESAIEFESNYIDGVSFIHEDNVIQKYESRNLCQAKSLNRFFASKDDIISCYMEEDDQLSHIVNLPKLKDLNNKEIQVRKILTTEQDTKILILDQDKQKQVYQMDLEKGKVIREFKIDGINEIQDICRSSKLADLTSNPVFLSMNQKNLFMMDPRVGGKEEVANVVKTQKIYKTNNQFTCMATNEDGNIAVGNQQGEIRLYSEIGKNAKNKYPGFGDPIRFIDTSKDGAWVVATCDKYLVVLPTLNNENLNGFKSQIKNKDKTYAMQLQLNMNDVMKYQLKNYKFTNARFDLSNDYEQFIIAGVNDLQIIWKLQDIVKRRIFNYQIKQMKDVVLESQFKFNQTDRVLTALPNDMCLQSQIYKKH